MVNSKNVIFIVSCMEKGGTQRVISNLANYLAPLYNVTIIMIIDSKCEYVLEDNIHLVDFSNRSNSKPRQMIRIVKKLHHYFREIQSENSTVFSFLVNTNLMVLFSSIGKGIPIIISERNDPKNDGRGFMARLSAYCLYPLAKKIVFQTNYAMQLFPHWIKKKGVIISNPLSGIDCVRNPETSREKKIVSVGRLILQKNHEMLIKAFAEVSTIFPDYSLTIYGEGPLRSALENQIKELDLEDRVFLPGVVDDIYQRIINASVFVLSSNYEGQSNALLEAMSLGLPCITTNASGINELVNSRTGILVKVGDVADLSNALISLLSDSALREEMGKAASQSLESLSIEHIINKWLELI